LDIGTPARYLQAHQDMLANRVTRFHLKDRRGNFDSATHSQIDDLSIIADDCTLKPGVEIVNSVLGPGCYIEERARIENSVLWSHTRVGTAAEVRGALIGRGCHIGRSAFVGPGCVLGDKTSLSDYTRTCV
jgi:NDP-sugar pyrophosphorylase family protein